MINDKARQLYDFMAKTGSGVEQIGFDNFVNGLSDENKRKQVYDYVKSKDSNMTLGFDEFSSGLDANPIQQTLDSAPINNIQPATSQIATPQSTQEPEPAVAPKATPIIGGRLGIDDARKMAARFGTTDTLPMGKEDKELKRQLDAMIPLEDIEQQALNRLANGESQEDVNGWLVSLYKDTTNPTAKNNIRAAMNSLYEGRIADVGKQVEEVKNLAYAKQDEKQTLLREWADIAEQRGLDPVANNSAWRKGRDEYFASKGKADLIEYNVDTDLQVANRLWKETNRLSNAATNVHEGETGDGWKNVGKGIVNQVLTGTTWSFGATDLMDMEAMIRIKQKIDAGEELDDMDKAIASALALNSEFTNAIGGVMPHGFKAGQTGAAAVPFMLQMGANPTNGLGIKMESKAIKGAIQSSLEKSGKNLVRSHADDVAMRTLDNALDLTAGQRRQIYNQLLKEYGQDGLTSVMAKRYGSRIAGDFASAAILANTIQAPTTAKNIIERYQGDLVDKGDGTYTFKEGEGLVGAALHGEGSQITEDFTEMMGEWGLGHYLGKLAEKTGLKSLSTLSTNNVNQFFNASANTTATKITKTLQRMGFDGFIPEVMEEEYGIVLHSLIGDGEAEITDLFDADTQLDIILGIGLFSGAMGAIQSGGAGYYHAKSKHELDKIDKINQGKSNEWKNRKDAIDTATDNELVLMLSDIAKRKRNGKATEMDDMVSGYIEKLMPYRGSSIARDIFNYTPEQREVRRAFDRGYSRIDANKVRQEYEHERAKMEMVYGKDVLDGIDANTEQYVATLGTSQQATDAQGLIDYLNAKAAYDGVMRSMNDEIENDIAEANGMIDATNNLGHQILAETRTGEQVHIISGSVDTDEEGAVIHGNANPSLVILHDNGKREMVDTKSITKVISDELTEDVQAQTDANIRNSKLQAFTDEIFGRIRPEQGKTYTIMMNDVAVDATVNGYVIDEQGNNYVNVTTPNGTIDMPLAEFQDAYVESGAREVVAESEQRSEERSLEMGAKVMAEDGTVGVITSTPDADGKYTISWDTPVNGKKVDSLTPDQFLPYDEQMQAEILAKNTIPVEEAEVKEEPVKEEPVAEIDPEEEEYTTFISKYGEKSGKKIDKALEVLDKSIEDEGKKLAKMQDDLDNAAPAMDDASTKAEAKMEQAIKDQQKKLEGLTAQREKYSRFKDRVNTPAEEILAPEATNKMQPVAEENVMPTEEQAPESRPLMAEEEFLVKASGVNKMEEEQWIRRKNRAIYDYQLGRTVSKDNQNKTRETENTKLVEGIVSETLDKFKDRNVKVVNRGNVLQVMAETNPNNKSGINDVRKAMAKRGYSLNGFYSGGDLYINAEDMRSIADIVRTFNHESSHADVETDVNLKKVIKTLVKKFDRETLDRINVGISGDYSYIVLDDTKAADEALAHMMQQMYFGQSAEEVLGAIGIEDDKLASIFNSIYNGQQSGNGTVERRRFASLVHNTTKGSRKDGGNTEARPTEVGDEGSGSSERSERPAGDVTPIKEGEDYLAYAERVGEGEDGAKSNPGAMMSTAYHGSAAKFDKFDTKFMSSGEGNQAYGWGIYVTTNKETGKKYAGIAAAENSFNGRLKRNNKDDIVTWINDKMEYDPLLTFDEAKQMVRAEIEMDETVASVKASEVDDITQEYAKEHGYRNLYTVDIPDDNGENYLHWDKPLTKTQSKKIADAVLAVPQVKEDYGEEAESEVRNAFNGIDGRQVEGTIDYFLGKDIDYATGADKNAEKKAKMLYDLGIVGMQVDIDRNGGKRYAGSNYVLYNADDVKITDHTMFSTAKDEEFRKAYEAGDKAKAMELVKAAFKEKYPNSIIVDENSEPKVLWHGGLFRREQEWGNNPNVFEADANMWLSDSKEFSDSYDMDGNNANPYFANITKPFDLGDTYGLIIDKDGNPTQLLKDYAQRLGVKESEITDLINWDYGGMEESAEAFTINREPRFRALLKDKGYDGCHDIEAGGVNGWMPVNNSQVKSADPFTFDDNGELIPLSKRFDEKKEDVRFSTSDASELQKNPDAKYPTEIEIDAIRFSVSKNNSATIHNWLNKWAKTQYTNESEANQMVEVVFDYIDENIEGPTEQLCYGKWFSLGAIRLEEDDMKVMQAVAVAKKNKVDPLSYPSPMAIIDAFPSTELKAERINPDDVPTLHKTKSFENGITIYNVDDSEESRRNMREIINTHFGKDCSPWCLLQGDENGKLTETSKNYWNHYNSYPKQVAFKDGKLLAFSANDKQKRVWWNRMDEAFNGIPAEGKIEGDGLGRSATIIYNRTTGKVDGYANIHKGNRTNGRYQEWSSENGNLLLDVSYKNGKLNGKAIQYREENGYIHDECNFKDDKLDGLQRFYHKNGKLNYEQLYKGGYITFLKTYYENGAIKSKTPYSHGAYDGYLIDYSNNGMISHLDTYKNDKLNGYSFEIWPNETTIHKCSFYDNDGMKFHYEYDIVTKGLREITIRSKGSFEYRINGDISVSYGENTIVFNSEGEPTFMWDMEGFRKNPRKGTDYYRSSDPKHIKETIGEDTLANLYNEAINARSEAEKFDPYAKLKEEATKAEEEFAKIEEEIAKEKSNANREPMFSISGNEEQKRASMGSYFSGAGLLEEGLKGIVNSKFGVEYSGKIAGVYRNNFGEHIITKDVRDVDIEQVMKDGGDVQYFHASPECKRASNANNNGGEIELDKELAQSTAKAIRTLQPQVVTIENVADYTNFESMDIIRKALEDGGYTTDEQVYNSADFGSPISRNRLIIRAVKEGNLPEVKKSETKGNWWDAVKDLVDTLPDSEGLADWQERRFEKEGIDWKNAKEPIIVYGTGHKDGLNAWAFASEQAPSITTKSGSGARIILPGGKVKEATPRLFARLMGVSDEYQLPDSKSLGYLILGNGIPVQLTKGVIAPLVDEYINNNTRFSTSAWLDKNYPGWLDNQVINDENGKKGQQTQVAGTLGTYKKVGEWIRANMPNAKVLDASSGMGIGTKFLRDNGMDIDDVEPYQSGDRKKNNPATFDSYEAIDKGYDYIISNAVLNVIPDDWRTDLLHQMADVLNDGGKMFINTRKAGEEKNIKNKIELDTPQEVLVGTPDKVTSYQRFFTPQELKSYVEDELGNGYSVEVANKGNSGTSGLAAVVVTKKQLTGSDDVKRMVVFEGLSNEEAQNLEDNNLTMEGGAIMNKEAQRLKHDTGYLTPNETMFSRTTWKNTGRESYLNRPGARKEVVSVLDNLASWLAANELIDEFTPKGEHKTVGTGDRGPLRTNVEYVFTFDVDTTCPRTFQQLQYVKQIEKKIGRPLSQLELVQLNELMRAYGQQIPCVYCYAENKRQAKKQYMLNYIKARHNVLSTEDEAEARKLMYGQSKSKDSINGLTKAANEVFAEWRSKRGGYNPNIEELFAEYNKMRDIILTILDDMKGDMKLDDMSAIKVQNLLIKKLDLIDDAGRAAYDIAAEWLWDAVEGRNHKDFTRTEGDINQDALAVWKQMTDYANSASGAKSVLTYVPYTDELAKLPQETKDYINGMGGLRMHSTNDFRIDYLFDYLQLIADMEQAGMLGHTYTKSPDFVRIFGKTGYRINMSIAAYEDENGNIIENEQEGFNWHTAQELRDAFENAGVMMMATSDKQLQFALDADWIDMIIPFHHSGLDKRFWKDMRAWMDYTSKQTERFLTKKDMMVRLKAKGVDVSEKMSAKEIEKLFLDKCGIKIAYDKDGKRIKPHFLPGQTIKDGNVIPGHGNNVQEYFRLCEEWGVTPRFQGIKVNDAQGNEIDITQHPGYIKLLKETARTDTPQQAVKFNLNEHNDYLGTTPIEYAKKLLEDQAKIGYEYPDDYGVVDTFIKEYVDNPKPMVYLPENARVTWREQNSVLRNTYGAWMKNDNAIPYHPATMLSTSVTPNYLHKDEVRNLPKSIKDGGKIKPSDYYNVMANIKANPLRNSLVEQGMYAPYRFVVKDINLDNYYIGTKATFNTVKAKGDNEDTSRRELYDEWNKMKESGKYAWHQSPLSDSEYLIDENTGDIYRFSNHWGAVSSCDWKLDVTRDIDSRGRDITYAIAKANIKDFTLNGHPGRQNVINPKVSEKYAEALEQTIVNYRSLLDGDEYEFTPKAKEHLEKTLAELESLKTSYDEGGIEAVKDTPVRYSTSVTPEQDNAYMDAVKAGDMEKAQQMVRDAFKAAFPDTKVVDENGEPMIVYHGTDNGGFTVFNNKISKKTNTVDNSFFFVDDSEQAFTYSGDNGEIYEEMLNITNPCIVDADGMYWDELTLPDGKTGTTNDIVAYAKEKGYDGVIFKDIVDAGYYEHDSMLGGYPATVYVSFSPNQIKSADPVTYDDNGEVIPLSQRFNPENNDIRFSTSISAELSDKLSRMYDDYNDVKIDAATFVSEFKDIYDEATKQEQELFKPIIDMMQQAEEDYWETGGREYSNSEDIMESIMDIANGNTGTMFSITGQKAAQRLDATIGGRRMSNLFMARNLERQGRSPKLILNLTGWQKGIDGMWKMEEPDGKFTDQFEPEVNEIYNLADIWEDDILFNAYPNLKDVKVVIDPASSSKRGHITIDGKEIHIVFGKKSSNGLQTIQATGDDMRSTMLHELQHYIQMQEGFARGGNPDMKNPNNANEVLGKDGYWRLAGEVESRNEQRRANIPFGERVKMLFEETADVAKEDQIVMLEDMTAHFEDETEPMVKGIEKKANTSFSVSLDKSRAKSTYDNGKITVYNPYDGIDVQAGVMRESFTHKDIRSLDGWEEFTDTARQMGNTEISRKAMYNGWDFDAAVESWIYDNADKMIPAFETMLHRNGIDLEYKMTPEELRMYLTKVKDYLDRADVESMKADLETEPKPMFSTTFKADAQQIYEAIEASRWAKFHRGWVDGTNSIKHLQDAILAETGHTLSDFEDAHTFINQIGSRSQAEFNEYTVRYINPIVNRMRILTGKNGVCSEADLLSYLMCKHGLERNEVFAKRDAQKEYDRLMKEGKLDGQTIDDLYDKFRKRDYSGLTALTGKSKVAEAEARARLIVGDMEKRINNFAAQHRNEYDSKSRHKRRDVQDVSTDALWESINNATKKTLKTAYEAGQISKENYDKLKDMFKYYIPLRGFDEKTADEVYDYYEHRGASVGSVVRKAKGRISIAANPVANIMAMAQAGIFSANKNKMKQRLLNLVENNPTKLAVVDRTWYVNEGTPEDPDWQPKYPHIPNNAKADDVAIILANFKADMEKKKLIGMAKQIKDKVDAGGYRTINKSDEEHMIQVKRGGEEYLIFINGNPKASQAINGLINPESKMSPEARWWKKMQRRYAALLTSWVPPFALTNGLRDRSFALFTIPSKEGAKYALQYEKNLWKTFARFGLISKENRGTLDERKELERYYREFVQNGAETGFTSVLNEREMERKLREMLGNPGVIIKIADAFASVTEYINRTIENKVRFATFMTSRQQGRSIQRSVDDAKNVTANFNRKGSGEMGQRVVSLFYLFTNAAVQATVSLNKAMGLTVGLKANADDTYSYGLKVDKEKLSRSVPILAFTALSGFALSLLSAMVGGDGDDDEMNPYDLLSDFEKKNNLIIPVGNGNFAKIPLDMQLRPFYGLGNTMFDIFTGRSDESTLLSFGESLASTLPVNIVEKNGLVPDQIAPIYEAYYANKNFAGIPIYKKNADKYLPEYQKVYKGTWDFMVNASKWWSEMGGGTESARSEKRLHEINPAKLEHVIEGYGGGTLTFFIQTGKFLTDAINKSLGNERKYTVRDFPFINRVAISTGSRNDKSRIKNLYHDNYDKAQLYKRRAKDYLKAVTTTFGTDAYEKANDQYQEFYNSPEYQMTEIVTQYSPTINALKEGGYEDEMLRYMEEMNAKIASLFNKNNENSNNK